LTDKKGWCLAPGVPSHRIPRPSTVRQRNPTSLPQRLSALMPPCAACLRAPRPSPRGWRGCSLGCQSRLGFGPSCDHRKGEPRRGTFIGAFRAAAELSFMARLKFGPGNFLFGSCSAFCGSKHVIPRRPRRSPFKQMPPDAAVQKRTPAKVKPWLWRMGGAMNALGVIRHYYRAYRELVVDESCYVAARTRQARD